jgi:hypothetical protein
MCSLTLERAIDLAMQGIFVLRAFATVREFRAFGAFGAMRSAPYRRACLQLLCINKPSKDLMI